MYICIFISLQVCDRNIDMRNYDTHYLNYKRLFYWCRERDLNPHIHCGTRDFKSLASTNSAIPAKVGG